MLPFLLLLLAGLRAASTAPHPRPHVTAAAPLPRAFAAPPPPPDPALECALKELLLNASMARVPWFRDVARIHDALRCCSARPERLPPLPAPAAPPPAAAATYLFVSAVNGSDAHDGGSPLAPLRSLHAAQAAARALRLRLGAAPRLTVHLAGTFYLPATLRLDAAEDARTTWRSWPGAEPAVVSGGLPLSGLAWGPSQRFPAPVLAAALPAAAPASGLLFALHDASSAGAPGGRRLPAAREPNGDAETQMQPTGWALCRGPAGGPLPFPAGAPPAPTHVEVDAPRRNVTAFPAWGRDHDPRNPPQGYVWYGEGGGAAAWMAGARTFWANKTLPGGLLWNATGGLDPRSGGRSSPFNASGWPATVAPAGRRRAHVFHDSLWGNWVFDIASVDAGAQAITFARGGWQEGRGGGIRAQPFFVEGEAAALDAPGEWWVDPASATLHLWPNASDGAPPALLVLPVLETLVAVGASAPGVALAGLAFQHTVDGLMEPYSVPEAGDWSLRLAGAVEVRGAAGTSLTGCAWQRTGGNGLLVTGAARDTLVEDCEFYLQGSSAIAVVGSAPYANSTAAAPTPGAAPAAYPSGVTIRRALVEGVGVLGKQSSALFVSVACGVVLQDSVLYSGPRSGVNWNDGFCGGSRIEGSVLFDWVRETRACVVGGGVAGGLPPCAFSLILTSFTFPLPRPSRARRRGPWGCEHVAQVDVRGSPQCQRARLPRVVPHQ